MGGLPTGPAAPIIFFKNSSTLILRHKITCPSVSTIFSPSDNTLTLIPFGSAKVHIYDNHSLGISSAVTDTVLFPKLFNKQINRASFFPGQKIVIHFDGKPEKEYGSELLIRCIKCDRIFHRMHTKKGSCFIVPQCKYCED